MNQGFQDKQLAIDVTDLTVAYNEKPVLWDIDFQVPSGNLLAIVGPNGAGKSTLMKCILGLIKPSAGQVLVLGRPFEPKSQDIAYVPQRSSVDWDFPTTVLDVVLMGTYGRLGLFRMPGRAERLKAIECLERVGMADFRNRQISRLSGGQQQRVFIARAFIQDALIYLMDEPFAGVDIATEKSIVALLHGLRAKGRTVVCVHHDVHTLKDYFDSVMMINVRRVAQGPVGEVLTEENLRRAYGGRSAFLTREEKSFT